MTKETIRLWDGKVIGFIETYPDGSKIVRDFYGRVKGKYDKQFNVTRDFYGRVVAQGDQSSMLLSMKL